MRPSAHAAALCLSAGLLLHAGTAAGLVIHRFGGADEPPPAEAGEPGVVFVQHAWTDFDPAAGGERLDLELTADSIASLRRDPTLNIAPLVVADGGEYIGADLNRPVWDGDPATYWEAAPYLCASFAASYLQCTDDFGTIGTANIALGSRYQIDRIRLVSGLHDPGGTVRAVRVFLAPQIPFRSYNIPPPFVPYAVEVRDIRDQVLDIPMPPNQDVGFVQVAVQEHTETWEIDEIEIYARGFAGRSAFTSDIVDFGRPMAWGQLRWGGLGGRAARVQVQTRSGLDDDPVRHWRFTGRGEEKAEVSAAAYARLAPGEKAGTSYDHGNWSFWSTYQGEDSLGTQVTSPSSRRFFQFRVEFEARADEGGQLRSLEYRASEPLATGLVGEVWPVEARVGEVTEFTYAMLPTLGADDAGFDRLEIESEALLGQVLRVRVDEVAAAYTVEASTPHRLVVRLPALRAADSGALVEVDFEARVLRYGDRFDARVANSGRPLEVPQRVSPGNATGAFDGDRLAVATAADEHQRLLRVDVDVPALTPNGDGVNDGLRLGYELYEITAPAQVTVEILDLSGRRVRRLAEASQPVGSYRGEWDGRDDGGRLAAPGIYILRVSADADRATAEATAVVHLVY